MNMIKNFPVTTKDMDSAKNIFGTDIASLKGKTTQCKPTPVVQDIVKIPCGLMEAQKILICVLALYTSMSCHFW